MNRETITSQSRWRLALTLATFIALAGLIYGLRKDIGGVIDNLGKVNAVALLLLILAQVFSHGVRLQKDVEGLV